MIANAVELRVSVRQLRIMEAVLSALREQLEKTNPDLLEVASHAYTRRIAALQEEIAEYLAAHPADVSLMLPRLEHMDVIDASPQGARA